MTDLISDKGQLPLRKVILAGDAKRVFSPRPEDVRQAQRVIDAMGDGTGAIMLDGKMEDDASVKQCKVVVALARELAARDPELKERYGF